MVAVTPFQKWTLIIDRLSNPTFLNVQMTWYKY